MIHRTGYSELILIWWNRPTVLVSVLLDMKQPVIDLNAEPALVACSDKLSL